MSARLKGNTVDVYSFISEAYLSDRAGLWNSHCLNGAIIIATGIYVSLRYGNQNKPERLN